ncbi:hypothetical protein D9Q98_010128 [Chlorella vulgaris]|uniref:Plastid lipid-associated protein/fibrillin conserved domain-containing protein n=1 Tax=Chlorella vulgaris TaxID=3077 RepID=A0A9D4TN52_CHLVU|nr:hypothetical protein D9Q98_010128 [Chlorella vulgaris]
MSAAVACSLTCWTPAARPKRAARLQNHRLLAASSSANVNSDIAERALLTAVDSLGYPAAIFPGNEPARSGIDSSIAQLEAATPTPSPLQPPSGRLLADWKLVYASDGTYVTRTAAAQALVAVSKLPGVGVADIQQSLSESTASSQLQTSNSAYFGLGPLGDWEVCINGVWDVQDGTLARVSFTGFTLQLRGLLGIIKLPRMAKVTVPIQNSRTADFYTTYLSDEVRIARGKSRNMFVFQKLPASAPR